MKDAKWIDIDLSKLDSLIVQNRKKEGAVEITVGLSPYDLPDGVRAFRNTESDRLRIEFRYLSDDEVCVQESVDEFVTMYLGQNTDRLYGIEVDTDALNANQVNLHVAIPAEIAEAFEKLDRQRRFQDQIKKRRHLRNHRVAAEALKQKQDELLANV